MDSLIKLLPDNIANQIAAGEVIQRPASVVKELVENAIDAEASEIQIIIKDAGRTLIQVIDNGKGMEPMDARMAFERHATSKIRQADDLFALTTLGFRGEALPSIAAVSHVVLQTKARGNEQGIRVVLEGSRVVANEPIACAEGANFAVKHLFFNVPARRKFLKTDDTEFRHIISAVHNVAAVHSEIAFTLLHNDQEVLRLAPATPKQRIIDLFGKRFTEQLLTINMETPLVHIRGFVSKTTATRKRGAQQYFFVNDRYMKHPYFHRMVMNAYRDLIPQGESPEYFLYFSVDPAAIDVNISPTKTEIKFEAEVDIASILYSAVREALMIGAAVPTLDFTEASSRLHIPVATPADSAHLPEPPTISPVVEFKSRMNTTPSGLGLTRGEGENTLRKPDLSDWDKFYDSFESKRFSSEGQQEPPFSREIPSSPVQKVQVEQLMLLGKYALFPHPQGLAIASIHRAQFRVQYERYRERMVAGGLPSQRLLFPSLVELNAKEGEEIKRYMSHFQRLGFDLSDMGQNTYTVNALPSGIEAGAEELLIKELIAECQASIKGNVEALTEGLLRQLTKFEIAQTSRAITTVEGVKELLNELLSLSDYVITPEGKRILSFMSLGELDKRF